MEGTGYPKGRVNYRILNEYSCGLFRITCTYVIPRLHDSEPVFQI